MPNKIRNEVIKKITNKNCYNIGNRSRAIRTAIFNGEPNDIILVAGKGHEEEQIYKNKTFFISDKKIIKNIIIRKNKTSVSNQNFFQNKKILKNI